MTTLDPTRIDHPGDAAVADTSSGGTVGRLLASEVNWLAATDHKRIGRLYLSGGILGLLATVVVNILLSLSRTGLDIDDAAIPQLLDAQLVGLVFGTMLPLGLGLCIAVVPMQLGARAIAFPRLAAAGFWMWFSGLVLVAISLANNGGGQGGDPDMVDLFLAAHGLMAIGIAAAAGSIATTVLTTRAPGMTMRRIPFLSMSALVTALGLLLAMPVLLGTLIYLFLDHRNSRVAFGGNVGLYEWAGWIFSQPTTFLFAIPAIGVLAEGAPLLFRQRTPARGVMFAGLALVGVSALAAVTQQSIHNVGADGSTGDQIADIVTWAMFNLVPLLGVVIVLLMTMFLAKPRRGTSPNVTPALAFGFLGAGMILVGMLGSALFAIDDLDLQGTVFSEGTIVYVTYGAVLGIVGGMAFWAPKLWGVVLPSALLLPLAALGLIATILASLPSYIAGFDQQRDIYDVLVTVGHVLMALTVVAFIGLVVRSTSGRDGDTDINPYGGQTLEWTIDSPAPTNNFVELPTVMSAEPVIDSNPNATSTESEA